MMTAHSSETQQKLFCLQEGKSPFSGLPLDRINQRFEIHHVKERVNGGGNSLINLQLLPIYEHLAIHFIKFRDKKLSEEERLREFDIVMGRLNQLTEEEKNIFYQLVEEKVGIRVRFY